MPGWLASFGAPLLSLAPVAFVDLLFISAAAAVLGNMRVIPVAIPGGLLLGIAQNVVSGYTGSNSGFSTGVHFFLLLAVLMVRGKARTGGRAATIVDGLSAVLERSGANALNIRIHLPEVSVADVNRQIERIGVEFLPVLKRELHGLLSAELRAESLNAT